MGRNLSLQAHVSEWVVVILIYIPFLQMPQAKNSLILFKATNVSMSCSSLLLIILLLQTNFAGRTGIDHHISFLHSGTDSFKMLTGKMMKKITQPNAHFFLKCLIFFDDFLHCHFQEKIDEIHLLKSTGQCDFYKEP